MNGMEGLTEHSNNRRQAGASLGNRGELKERRIQGGARGKLLQNETKTLSNLKPLLWRSVNLS